MRWIQNRITRRVIEREEFDEEKEGDEEEEIEREGRVGGNEEE